MGVFRSLFRPLPVYSKFQNMYLFQIIFLIIFFNLNLKLVTSDYWFDEIGGLFMY